MLRGSAHIELTPSWVTLLVLAVEDGSGEYDLLSEATFYPRGEYLQ